MLKHKWTYLPLNTIKVAHAENQSPSVVGSIYPSVQYKYNWTTEMLLMLFMHIYEGVSLMAYFYQYCVGNTHFFEAVKIIKINIYVKL